jgi:hypothetical protein
MCDNFFILLGYMLMLFVSLLYDWCYWMIIILPSVTINYFKSHLIYLELFFFSLFSKLIMVIKGPLGISHEISHLNISFYSLMLTLNDRDLKVFLKFDQILFYEYYELYERTLVLISFDLLHCFFNKNFL